MVKLSSYSGGYDDDHLELTPWQFWTDEQKSHVLWQAYKQHFLTSKDVKSYLSISRQNMFAQFTVPVLSGVAYFGFLRDTLFRKLYRMSPHASTIFGVGLVGITTVLWANLSPFYLRKQSAQEKLLDTLYHKIGTTMKLLNDAVPRTRTSGQIDRYSMWIYFRRNYIDKEIGDDYMPPLLTQNPTRVYSNKKVSL